MVPPSTNDSRPETPDAGRDSFKDRDPNIPPERIKRPFVVFHDHGSLFHCHDKTYKELWDLEPVFQ